MSLSLLKPVPTFNVMGVLLLSVFSGFTSWNHILPVNVERIVGVEMNLGMSICYIHFKV